MFFRKVKCDCDIDQCKKFSVNDKIKDHISNEILPLKSCSIINLSLSWTFATSRIGHSYMRNNWLQQLRVSSCIFLTKRLSIMFTSEFIIAPHRTNVYNVSRRVWCSLSRNVSNQRKPWRSHNERSISTTVQFDYIPIKYGTYLQVNHTNQHRI